MPTDNVGNPAARIFPPCAMGEHGRREGASEFDKAPKLPETYLYAPPLLCPAQRYHPPLLCSLPPGFYGCLSS
ncbi:hypothetical protein CALVIDRAFT_341873 [Calocera viscosa TUFC12733]|uniref:Uncharacterized protein n=1 Tax=Calocera viscosa (strain TUFC12733) TaxID=1330018 RepID=A0A167HEW7_CALVF|nr:hypothetical protein CALVIDRAFT_341873 [Calocera viscosa TUFC12733]